jgi:hypothetical protein
MAACLVLCVKGDAADIYGVVGVDFNNRCCLSGSEMGVCAGGACFGVETLIVVFCRTKLITFDCWALQAAGSHSSRLRRG